MPRSSVQAGDYDRSFGQDGYAETPPFFGAWLPRNFAGLTLQDDNILISALALDERGGRHCGIIRLAPNGSQDMSFGIDGVVAGRFNANEHAQPEALIALADGPIILLGLTADPARPFPQPHYLILEPNGQGPTPSFKLEAPDGAAAVIGSGRLTALGPHFMAALTFYGIPGQPTPNPRVYRLNLAGDPSFPDGSFIEIGLTPGELEITGLIQLDTVFYLSGIRLQTGLPDESFIARYTVDGKLDPMFGNNGSIIVKVENRSTHVKALIQRPDGHLIVVGSAQDDSVSQAMVWQFTALGAPDQNFNNGDPLLDSAARAWHSASLDPAGRLITFGTGARLEHKRYLMDGSTDPDYLPSAQLIGIPDAMLTLNRGANTLFAYNATASIGLIGTVAAIQN
ncbi:hypothetical protein [Pseudomonas sp. KU43P]|uniref:hypothetical protein n=1 Tax=Pseudomonas sp. KU43P TaxID=2487887 RepID=UPI002953827C|nr:hypothetical protein [Pseudomonas sp. KU43P]